METIAQINDSRSRKIIMTRLRTIILLTTGLLCTILFEIWFNSSKVISPKITLLERIQSSLTLKTLINIILIGSIFLVLLIGTLMMASVQNILVSYITLLKFFEFIPPLIDLINLLFVYQFKIKDFNTKNSSVVDIEMKTTNNSSNRFILSFVFAFIRLIMSLDIVRRQCDGRWKRQIIVIGDLALFILVNASLIRYSNPNLIRTGRKIILGFLIFQLNNLFYNKTFWTSLMNQNENARHQLENGAGSSHLKMIHLILSIRQILSLCIIYLFAVYTILSIIIADEGSLFPIRDVCILLKSYGLMLVVCLIILRVIHWDTQQNRNTLDRYGMFRFCTGINLLPGIRSTTVVENVRSPSIKKKQQTCLVCYDDKDSSEFDCLFTNNCRHLNRSVCNICLFLHVQKTFEITFTDDIHCPELECGVKLDYGTVRNILFFSGDEKLFERYDRYVFHRQLEQMDEFIWCSNSLCNMGQLNEGGLLNNIVTCFNCHGKTCFTHKVKWHDGLTCQEYDMGIINLDEESSRRWIVENSKKCPNCPYQIEKNDGCDHMTCTKCRYEFCWSCLADFQPIRQHGNHRHHATCKHYAPYDEE